MGREIARPVRQTRKRINEGLGSFHWYPVKWAGIRVPFDLVLVALVPKILRLQTRFAAFGRFARRSQESYFCARNGAILFPRVFLWRCLRGMEMFDFAVCPAQGASLCPQAESTKWDERGLGTAV